MVNHIGKTSIVLLVLASLFLVGPVTAAINVIAPGNTVFIGEDGLDISGAVGGATRIGWWASGASITASSPDYSVPISNPANFYVSPTDFGSHTGSWYRLNSLGKQNGVAFIVVDPSLDLKVEDTTVDVDVTNKWVPTGDSVRFKVETNLLSLTQRSGVTAVPVTIKVQSPDGAIYTSLIDSAGMSTSTDIQVTSIPYYTLSIWDTGRRETYTTGSYTLWAECNVNFMNDRYGEAGKTQSIPISLLNQDQNPLLGTVSPTTTPTIQMTTTPTSLPPTVSPPLTTQITTISTTPAPTEIYETTTTVPSQIPSPAPTQTKSPGFEAILAIAAIITGIVLYFRNE